MSRVLALGLPITLCPTGNLLHRHSSCKWYTFIIARMQGVSQSRFSYGNRQTRRISTVASLTQLLLPKDTLEVPLWIPVPQALRRAVPKETAILFFGDMTQSRSQRRTLGEI